MVINPTSEGFTQSGCHFPNRNWWDQIQGLAALPI